MKAKIILVLLLAGVISGPAQTATNPPPVARRPNIIFILADDLGYGDLSCYGQTKFATPNLDKMAAEGIRFTDAYAGCTVCSPSRAALMLGQHTGHLNIRGNSANSTILPEEVTVADVLQRSGYATALFGKWGLAREGSSGVPQKKGFEDFWGYLGNVEAHNYYPEFLWRYFPPRLANEGFDGKMSIPENEGGKKGKYSPDMFTQAALRFVSISRPAKFNQYRPFFLFLSYITPHANNEEGRRTGNGMQVPSDAPYSSESWPQVEKNKAAMIARMDADIGKLVDKLKSLGIDDDTLIVFSGDNGPHKEGGVDPEFFKSAGPFRGHKRDMTEGGIRTPLIMRWPMKIKPGQVSDFMTAFWDFLPTAADVAHVEPPKNIDGISILPLLTGQTQTNRHEYLYWEFHERGFQQAIRMGKWKGIRPQADEKLELYDVKTDPREQTDLAEKNPEVVAKLEQLLKTARTDSDKWPIKKVPKGQKFEDPK